MSPWLRKEDDLVALVHRHSKGEPTTLTADEYAAAVRIGRVGNLLTKADHVVPERIPRAFEGERAGIERLSSRFLSLGLKNPLTATNLAHFSPNQVRALLQNARKAGLLDDGPSWTFKFAAARTLVHDIDRQVTAARHLDQQLEQQLIGRKG